MSADIKVDTLTYTWSVCWPTLGLYRKFYITMSCWQVLYCRLIGAKLPKKIDAQTMEIYNNK